MFDESDLDLLKWYTGISDYDFRDKEEMKLQRILDQEQNTSSDDECEDGDDYDDKMNHLLEQFGPQIDEMEQKIIDGLGYSWKTCRDKALFYVCAGRCHQWNTRFGFWLAQRVCPDLKWTIRKSSKHTTVYCKSENMVFDILYFFLLDGRWERYFLGKFNPNTDQDPTLGGKEAYLDSATPRKRRIDPIVQSYKRKRRRTQ